MARSEFCPATLLRPAALQSKWTRSLAAYGAGNLTAQRRAQLQVLWSTGHLGWGAHGHPAGTVHHVPPRQNQSTTDIILPIESVRTSVGRGL